MSNLTYEFSSDAQVRAFVADAEVLLGPNGTISFPDTFVVQISHSGIDVIEHTQLWDQFAVKHGGTRATFGQRDIAPANKFSLGVQLLHVAIVRGDREQVKMLVELNPGNVNATHEDGSGTALHRAAYCGDHLMVSDLLANGADPNERDSEGRTPLHMTAHGIGGPFERGGHTQIVKLLVAAGADVKLQDNRGDTARSFAIRQQKSGIGEVVAALEHAFGQTPAEVERVLGTPEKKINLGVKGELFLYADMKIFFVDGKVSKIR